MRSICFAVIGVGLACGAAAGADRIMPAGHTVIVEGTCSDCEHESDCDECGGGIREGIKNRVRRFKAKYREVHNWPKPYTEMAATSVQTMLAAQVQKGWTRATTLQDYHFDPETHELNRAGRIHLNEIARHTPLERRFIFIEATDDASDTQTRVADVRRTVCAWVGEKNVPPLQVVQTPAYGAKAEEMKIERERFLGSIPTPRLPAVEGSSGSTTTASSGAR